MCLYYNYVDPFARSNQITGNSRKTEFVHTDREPGKGFWTMFTSCSHFYRIVHIMKSMDFIRFFISWEWMHSKIVNPNYKFIDWGGSFLGPIQNCIACFVSSDGKPEPAMARQPRPGSWTKPTVSLSNQCLLFGVWDACCWIDRNEHLSSQRNTSILVHRLLIEMVGDLCLRLKLSMREARQL